MFDHSTGFTRYIILDKNEKNDFWFACKSDL